MRAIVISRPGGPEVLEIRQVDAPRPGAQEVLVDVRATAVNRADLLQRRGRYPAPADSPADIPGLEFAGVVTATGENANSWRPGDRVMGILGGGGYAETIRVHERLCLPVPRALTWTQAAAIPEAFLTAYDGLFRNAGLAAGESLLVHAAGSGIGTAAIQLGSVAGAHVVGTSRSEAKCERLSALGCRAVLADGSGETETRLRAHAPDGFDVILDLIGGPALETNLSLLRERGRLVMIGLLGGARAEIPLGRILTRRLTVSGSVLRTRTIEEKIALVGQFERRISPMLARGELTAVVDSSFPLDRAAEAHARMERNENFGKIVLTCDGDRS